MSRNSSIINFHARGTPELKENEVNLQRHLLAKFRFFLWLAGEISINHFRTV